MRFHLNQERVNIFASSLLSQLRIREKAPRLKSSQILTLYLKQRNYPHWTAWYGGKLLTQFSIYVIFPLTH